MGDPMWPFPMMPLASHRSHWHFHQPKGLPLLWPPYPQHAVTPRVLCPHPPYMLKLVQLWSFHKGYSHVQTCSFYSSDCQQIGAYFRLKCLLVHSLIHSFNSYPAGLVLDASTSIGSSFLALLSDLPSVTLLILLDLLLLLLETLSDPLGWSIDAALLFLSVVLVVPPAGAPLDRRETLLEVTPGVPVALLLLLVVAGGTSAAGKSGVSTLIRPLLLLEAIALTSENQKLGDRLGLLDHTVVFKSF